MAAQIRPDPGRFARGSLHGAAPGVSGFIALLEAFRPTGGTAPGEIIGRLLQEHQAGGPVSLEKLIDTGQAFGFEWRASLWVPMFQFDADELTLKLRAQQVRAELPSRWSGWMQASWFASPHAWLEGRRPVEVLDSDLQAVLWAAQSSACAEKLPLSTARRGHEVAAQV